MALKAGPSRSVQRERLSDQVYNLVREEMRRGLLAPGARLKEVELAARLGVSRTPVREALFQLARDGLIEEQDQGFRLPLYDDKELQDRLEIRFLLEPAVARHAALVATKRDHARLRKALAEETSLVEKDDGRRFLVANLQFKHELLRICPNKLLVKAAQIYDDHFQYFRLQTFAQRHVRETVVRWHREVLQSIADGNGAAAAHAMRSLLKAAADSQPVEADNASPGAAKKVAKTGTR
jgi:DNA-binding GntR family transcriptional regulator